MPPQSRTRRLSPAEQASMRRRDDAELRRRDTQTEAILAQLAQSGSGRPMPSHTTPAPDAYQGDLNDVLLGGRDAAMRAPTRSERVWGKVEEAGEGLRGPLKLALGAVGLDPQQWVDRRATEAAEDRQYQAQIAGLTDDEIVQGLMAGTVEPPVSIGVMADLPGMRAAASAWKGKPGAPYIRTPEGALVVSTRVPTGKKAIDELGPLMTGREEVMRDPELVEKMANILGESPVLTAREAALNPPDVLNRFVVSAEENLRYLMDRMKPYAERSARWYEGGNRLGRELAESTGLVTDQGMGVLAVLSPQKQWDMNVVLAQRVADHATTFARQDALFTPALYQKHREIRLKSITDAIADRVKKGNITADDGKRALSQGKALIRRQGAMVDKPWSALDFGERAHMVRAHDEVVNPQHFSLFTPEGDVYDIARNIGGEPSRLVWNSNKELAKAIGIIDDPSPENISRWLGLEHKVRSFFNNLNAPYYGRLAGERGPGTIDTHQVAASHMSPLGASSPFVERSMGKPAPKQTNIGIRGTNPLYQQALTQVVQGTPYLPRQAQSITWEGIQGVFSPAQKKNKALQAEVGRIWADYRSGNLSKEKTLDAVINAAGGFRAPGWASTALR